MDLSLQLQVPEQDLEEFPERIENPSSRAEPKYPLFQKKKRKRKSPPNKNQETHPYPKTEEAKPPSQAPTIPCILDIHTAPTPELVYALSRKGRGRYKHGKTSKGRRRNHQLERHIRVPSGTNESHGRIGSKTSDNNGRNDPTPHHHRQEFGKDSHWKRRNRSGLRRERETRNTETKTHPTPNIQRRKGRKTRGPSPQSRGLDGSHRDNCRARSHPKLQVNLDHLAREWYNNTGEEREIWKSLTTEFSRYFSTQGKSIRNLHFRWNRFKFDPATDDIKEFIRNVQECAAQLNYSEEAL